LISGGTGPLVYPAGHVYVFYLLHILTDAGSNIRLAQYIFGVIHLCTYWIVCKIYTKSRFQPSFLLLLSKRILSIYSLRLFNDPIAMLFLYASILLFLKKRLKAASLMFSVALSVKMNILLYLPGYLFLLYQSVGAFGCIFHAALIFQTQVNLFKVAFFGLPVFVYIPF
jgi:alpha-1,3-mannosyltransferase